MQCSQVMRPLPLPWVWHPPPSQDTVLTCRGTLDFLSREVAVLQPQGIHSVLWCSWMPLVALWDVWILIHFTTMVYYWNTFKLRGCKKNVTSQSIKGTVVLNIISFPSMMLFLGILNNFGWITSFPRCLTSPVKIQNLSSTWWCTNEHRTFIPCTYVNICTILDIVTSLNEYRYAVVLFDFLPSSIEKAWGGSVHTKREGDCLPWESPSAPSDGP